MVPMVTLSDGTRMPQFGFGTYKLQGQECEDAIKYAIDVGYRHFDTACMYQNEREVGNAIRAKIDDGTVKREEMFVTTKLSVKMHQGSQVLTSCKESLERLGLDYIDLFLIHSPVSMKDDPNDPDKMVLSDIDYLQTWRGMEMCETLGLVRCIGVSNFNSEQITRVISAAIIKPVNNQVEVTLNLPQKSLIEFCKKHDIVVTGYSPLGRAAERPQNKNCLLDPDVLSLGEKYGKTPAQIALRFVYQMGAAPIPKSATKSHIKENIEIFDFNLTDEEMNILQSIGTGQRAVSMTAYKDSKYFPLNIPF